MDPATSSMSLSMGAEPIVRRAAGRRARADLRVWTRADAWRLHLEVTVSAGWYVYPPGATDGLPVTVSIVSDDGSRPLVLTCTEAVDGHLSGRFAVEATVEHPTAGSRVQIRLQACDGRACERPEFLTFADVDAAAPPSVLTTDEEDSLL